MLSQHGMNAKKKKERKQKLIISLLYQQNNVRFKVTYAGYKPNFLSVISVLVLNKFLSS